MYDKLNEEMMFPKNFKPLVRHGKIYDLFFIGYDFKPDSTLKVVFGITMKNNSLEHSCDYNKNCLVERKIDLSKAIINGVDYAEEIVDDFFGFDGTRQDLWLNMPMTIALNSKELTKELKCANKITLKLDVIDFEYESEEDYEDGDYSDFQLVDSFIFTVVL